MPDAAPAVAVSQELPADYALPSGIVEKARHFRLVPYRPPPPPCPEGDAGGGRDAHEIVVCAARDGADFALGPPLPDPPTTMDDIRRKLSGSLGPVLAHPASGTLPDGSAWIGVTLGIRF